MHIARMRAAARAACSLPLCFIAFAQLPTSFNQMEAGNQGRLKPHVFTTFSTDMSCFAEGLAADHEGNLYGATPYWGQNCRAGNGCGVIKVTPDGQLSMPYTFSLDYCWNIPLMLGLAFDEQNNLYVDVLSIISGNTGVWRAEQGTLVQVFSLPDGSFPNSLAFHNGDLYVTDTWTGAVWKKGRNDPDGTIATLPWYSNLDWLNPAGVGANGIAFYKGAMYVGVSSADKNDTTGAIVRIPVTPDGSPGDPTYFVPPDPRLHGVDGIAFDVSGALWFTNAWIPSVGIVEPDGTVRVLSSSTSWMDYPTQIVFGQTPGTKGTIFVSNSGVNTGNANLTSLFVGVPGLPIPAR